MYLTGFADEAGDDAVTQIKATRELGWNYIESRNISGGNIVNIPESDFAAIADQLENAGIKINCFGSEIANWKKRITDPFEETIEEVERAVPRMQRLGTKLIRIMSYVVSKDANDQPEEDQMKDERFRRLREIVKRFEDAGITPVHENCMNYGGLSYLHTLEMIEQVPGLKLVFDTGNPVFTDDHSKRAPRPKQSSWEFYCNVREHISYVHIKDARFVAEKPGAVFPELEFTFPGEGDGEVKEIVKDLLDRGYNGGFSMEPHLAVVFHDDSKDSTEEIKYTNYVEYGRRFMSLLADLGYQI